METLTLQGRLLALTANVMTDTGVEEESLEYVKAWWVLDRKCSLGQQENKPRFLKLFSFRESYP